MSLKRYNKHDGEIEEEELCLFVLLIKKEIDFLHDFEGAKIDLFPRVKKNQIKRIAKLVKKASDARQGDATSENIITFN